MGFELAEAAGAGGDGLDAPAAVAVSLARGNGAAVRRDGQLPGVGVFDLDEELSQPDGAVKRERALRFLQRGDGVQRIFQRV